MAKGIRMTSQWRELDDPTVASLGGHMGVYMLRSADGEVILIGFAGGKSPFGLRGELRAQLEKAQEATWFRCEVTTSYLSRYYELLMTHLYDHGTLPRDNQDDPQRLGRLHPA